MNSCIGLLTITGFSLTTMPRFYAMIFHPDLTQAQFLRSYWSCWLPGLILLILALGLQILIEDKTDHVER